MELKRKRSVEAECKMIVIENRKELVDQIKSKEMDVGQESLNRVAKHVAAEAVDKCAKQHRERSRLFLDDLYKKRFETIRLLAQQ